ncbi:hypothetical protein [Bradyrhizobium sp. 8-10B]|uniref:hypothetical protein n=1 Tax=Bradyrhizobium sp. 8-10B TaxID=3344579 RepID=UPI0035C08FA2
MLPHITAAMIDNWKSFHMLKYLSVAFAALFSLLSVANAAGTVPGFSLTPQFDNTGKAASGCKLYVIQAGTVSTPQNPYFDSSLTQVAPNPLTCDATGRVGQFFVADGTIKLRLTDKNGVQIFVGDNLLVVGPSSGGGGGGGTVDPTTILATGDFKQAYGTSILTGFVRCNGRTIGNATSGATERANADTSALFAFLWQNDPNLAVSGGRGANAAADFSASKTITLPDCRGRVIAGLADMGNTAANWLTSTYFGATPTTLGAVSTTTDHVALATANLPPYTPSGSVSTGVTSTVTQIQSAANGGQGAFATNSVAGAVGNLAGILGITLSSSFTGAAQGGTSTPFSSLPPTILTTIYIKL